MPSDRFLGGQDLYFLGFPYGLSCDIGDANAEFPMPLVKRGLLSTVLPNGKLIIDGHNNRGFSGGPVVFPDLNSPGGFKVGAVISSYRSEPEPIYDEHGVEMPLKYYANTGLVIAYSIWHVLKLIDANPIGVPSPST